MSPLAGALGLGMVIGGAGGTDEGCGAGIGGAIEAAGRADVMGTGGGAWRACCAAEAAEKMLVNAAAALAGVGAGT